MKTNIWLVFAFTAVQVACDKKSEAPAQSDKAPDAKSEHGGLPERVRVTPQVVKDAGIKIAPLGKSRLSATVSLTGEVTANPNKIARVSSPAAGRIARVEVDEGAQVRSGDIIAILKVPELGKIRSALSGATAKAKAARSNAQRLKELADKEVGSKQAALDAEAEASALESDAKAAREQSEGMGVGSVEGSGYELVLRAPITGVVTARNAVIGQPVTANEAIATIAQLDELWFLGRIFEKDLGELRTGAAADVLLNAYPKQRFSGHVDYIGKQVDPVVRTLIARIPLQNPKGLLRIGLFGTAQVTLETEQGEPVLAVPTDSLTEIGGKPVVFVQEANGDFVRHDVVIGREGVGIVEIQAGLVEGQNIAIAGVFSLKSILLKSTMAQED